MSTGADPTSARGSQPTSGQGRQSQLPPLPLPSRESAGTRVHFPLPLPSRPPPPPTPDDPRTTIFSRDARVLALLERIAAGVEGLRDEQRAAAALAALAQQAQAAEAGGSLRSAGSPSAPAGAAAINNAALLTARDLARLLRIDPRTLRELRHAGEVPPPIKVGRLLRWRATEVERWLAEARP